MRLADYQQRFQAALLDPKSTASDAEIAMKAGPERYRIAIHHSHFWNRMHDSAAFRHPLLARVLGERELRELVGQYIAALPPRSFTNSEVVEHLAAFLEIRAPWADSPMLAHLAAFDFARSGLRLRAEEATVTPRDLVGVSHDALARATFRLKQRALVTATLYRFEPDHIEQLPRDAMPDREPTHWLIYVANRRLVTTAINEPVSLALRCLADGVTLAELFARQRGSLTAAELDALFDRCLRAGLLVASPGGD